MSLPRTIEVNISGRRFTIKTDKDFDYVKSLASRLEAMVDKVKSSSSKITFEKALLVVCFYLLDENENLKKQIKGLGYEIKRLEEGAKVLIESREEKYTP